MSRPPKKSRRNRDSNPGFSALEANEVVTKEGRKPEYPDKTPDEELKKMPHTKARNFKPRARLEPALQHWWQVRKADALTVTPRVAP